MDLKTKNYWKKFIEDSCGNDGVIKPTRFYTAVAEKLPFLLTHKLVLIAGNDDFDDFDQSTRSRAAFLLQDMADHPRRLDDAYPTVDRETRLPYLRCCSFRLMADNDDKESSLHKSGKALVKKLILLALRHGENWEGFLEWVQRGFSGQPLVLESILDIFCEVRNIDLDLWWPFALFLDPIVLRNYEQFRTRLIHLLQSGGEDGVLDNDRGFKLLLCFYSVFLANEDHQTSVMEAAITSPIFDYDGYPHPHHEKMIFAVTCIKLCIKHAPIEFSNPMERKLNDIIDRLNSSPEPIDRDAATELFNSISGMVNRILHW